MSFPQYAKWVTAALALSLGCPVFAQADDPGLFDMSLEQLMNVEITSSARRPQSLTRASRAVYVITAEDIRQAGPVRIEELLRLVPGMDVFQTGGLASSVGARGYVKWNNERMQMLLDGRPLYDPYLGGALFYLNPVFLEEIDRIEVIRGSAGVAWGVNAVNGVINIITKKAADTQGLVVSGSVGNREFYQALAGYGGTSGPWSFRGMAGLFHDNGFGSNGGDLLDDYYSASQGTVRAEFKLDEDTQITFTGGGQNAVNNKESLQYTNFLWEKRIDNENTVQFRWTESYIERNDVYNYFTGSNNWLYNHVDTRSREEIFEFQHNALWDSHNIVWGADYTRDVYRSSPRDALQNTVPEDFANDHVSAFIEDEITLRDNLWWTLGYRAYYDEITHYDWAGQTALVWEFTPDHFLRGSLSRAFRRPTLWQDFRAPAPGANSWPIQGEGNDRLGNEHMVSYELGYRGQLDKNLFLNVEAYLNKDSDMLAKRRALVEYYQPWLPGSDWTEENWYDQWDNVYSLTTYGLETSVDWKPFEWWLVRGFHTYMHQTDRNRVTNWRTGETGVILSPKHRFGVTNRFELDPHTTLNTQLYWTDTATSSLEYIPGKPFWKLDVRLARRFWNDKAEVAVGVFNALDHSHPETGYDWGSGEFLEVPRLVYMQFRYTF
ncbi:MAG: TonB-dependent receptor [Planctomycetaceae bacterium]|nr:TonB-dependent receptor [Planctomycetaceae bacterium]